MANEIKLDEMNDEQKQSFLKHARLKNHKILAWMESVGSGVDNIGTMRHETFMAYLVDLGIVSLEQMLMFDCRWEIQLNEELVEQSQKIQEQIAAQRAPKLLLPPGSVNGRG